MDYTFLVQYKHGELSEDEFSDILFDTDGEKLVAWMDMAEAFGDDETWKLINYELSSRHEYESARRSEHYYESTMHDPGYIYDLTHESDWS